MKILKKYDQIKSLLIEKEIYRDNYFKLITRIWWDEIGKSEAMSAEDFLSLLANGKLSHPESIMRTRRRVQEDNCELRGESYLKRITEEQEAVKKELREFTKPHDLFTKNKPEHVSNCCGATMQEDSIQRCPDCLEYCEIKRIC